MKYSTMVNFVQSNGNLDLTFGIFHNSLHLNISLILTRFTSGLFCVLRCNISFLQLFMEFIFDYNLFQWSFKFFFSGCVVLHQHDICPQDVPFIDVELSISRIFPRSSRSNFLRLFKAVFHNILSFV